MDPFLLNRRHFLGVAAAAAAAPGSHAAPVSDLLAGVDPRAVRLSGYLAHRIERTLHGNILKLNIDEDFLRVFREKKSPSGFIGAGKLLDAVVRLAYYTGDARALALKKHLAGVLAGSQLADGYAGMYQPASRLVKAWDIHEQAYILLGLVSDYQLFGETASLAAARKLGDYFVAGLGGKFEQVPDTSEIHLAMLTTGFDRAMLALYRATGEERYLRMVTEDAQVPSWRLDIVEGRRPPYYGHAYAFMTRCLAQLELYRMSSDPQLLIQTRKALDYLRRRGGLLITGSASKTECWYSDQSGEGDLTETCATAYFIRTFDHLLRLEGRPLYGDLMERAIYNALAAAQSPDGRRLRYYAPFEGPRVYWDRDTYCCPNNFRRIVAELPQLVFYSGQDGFLVNLYEPSTATLKLEQAGEVRVTVETEYPNSGNVRLRVEPAVPGRFTVSMRIPRWCRRWRASVNGARAADVAEGFLRIRRRWQSGDAVDLRLEMPWRFVKGFHAQEGRVALMRGPLLFSLNPARSPSLGDGDLRELVIDPRSVRPPEPDATVRPGGLAARLKGTLGGRTHDLLLTEFPDPDARATYFRATDLTAAADDELLERRPA
jgi:DUF1680 family protein